MPTRYKNPLGETEKEIEMKSIFSKLLKKKKLFISLVSVIVLGLGVAAYMIIGNATAGSETISAPSATQNMVMEKPSGKSVTDLDPKQNLYIAQGELKRAGSFKGVSNGSTVSAGVEQKVYSRRVVKGDTVFKESVSASSMVQVGEQRMAHGESYVIRPASSITSIDQFSFGDTASRVSKAAFEDRYGCRGTEMSSYILNDETIVSAVYNGYDEATGLYSFTYALDNDAATYFILHEMRTNAGTKKFPSFEKALVTVTMNAEWKVHSFETDCVYKVALFGGVSCTEHLTEIFSEIGEVEEIPEYAFFEPYFDAAESDEAVKKEPDALGILAELFAAPLANGRINAAVDAVVLGEPITVNASVGIDIKAADILKSLTADVKLGDLFVRYDQDGIVLKYGDFAAKTTVDEIKSLVGAIKNLTSAKTENATETATEKAGGFDASSILSAIKMELGETDCTLTLPLELGGVKIEAIIKGKAEGEGDDRSYTFDGATVTVGDYVTASVRLVSEPVAAPDLGEAASLGAIFDKIKSGKLDFVAGIGESELSATLDLNRKYVGAKFGDLTATLTTERALVNYGNISAKMNFADLKNKEFVGKITAFVNALATKAGNEKLGAVAAKIEEFAPVLCGEKSAFDPAKFDVKKLDVAKILGILRDIKATKTADGTEISLALDGVNARVSLDRSNGKYSFGGASVEIAKENGEQLSLTLAPAPDSVEPLAETDGTIDLAALVGTALPEIEKLVAANGYAVSLDGITIDFGATKLGVKGEALFDGENLKAEATVSLNGKALVKAEVYLVNGRLYGEVGGVKFAFDLGEIKKSGAAKKTLSKIVGAVKGYSDALDKLIGAVENFIANFDPIKDIRKIAFNESELSASAKLGEFGLVNAALTFDSGVKAKIAGLKFGNVSLGLDASVKAYDGVVTAPGGDYTTNVKVSFGDVSVAVSANLLNKSVNAKTDDLSVSVADGKVLLSYGKIKAKAKLSDVKTSGVIDDVTNFISALARRTNNEKLTAVADKIASAAKGLDNGISIDKSTIRDIINGIRFENNALSVSALGATVTIKLTETETAYSFGGIEVIAGEGKAPIAIELAPLGEKVAPLTEDGGYVDLIGLARTALPAIEELIDASGYEITIGSLGLNLDGTKLGVKGKAIYDGENLALSDLVVKVNGKNFLKAEIYLVDGTLYGEANGVRFAAKVNASGEKKPLAETLTALKGYNDYLDDVITAVEELLGGKIDPKTLLSSLAFGGNKLTAGLNLNGFGAVIATIDFNGGVSVSLPSVTAGRIALSLEAGVKTSNEKITKPSGDYSTRLEVNVDKENSVFARLDLINGEYDFLVTDPERTAAGLGIRYNKANSTFYIGYGDTLVKGNVGGIKEIIAKIKEVAKEQFGDKLQSAVGALDGKIDLKQIVKSVKIASDDNGVSVTATALGFNVSVTADENFGLKISVPLERTRKTTDENGNEISDKYTIKTLTVTAGDGSATYRAFPEIADYVDIATVFEEYYDVMVSLVKTNGWKFTVSTVLEFGGNAYKIENAEINFMYYGKDDFGIKLAATVQKKGSDGNFAPSFSVDLALTGGLSANGRVFITYNDLVNENSELRFTVSTDVLAKIVNKQLGDLRSVIPQLDDVLNESACAMKEAFGTERDICLAEILQNVSYAGNNLNVCIDGSMLIGKLGVIDLTASRHGDHGLKATLGDLVYYDNDKHENVSFALKGFTATAEAFEVAGKDASDEQKAADYASVIGAYDQSAYINLDSLSSLVSSFVTTAKAEDNGKRTFRLQGTVPVKLVVDLGLKINVSINLGVDARIDVEKNEQGKDVIYVAAKISRGNLDGNTARLAFNDLGGDSYIYYNGENNTITLARDSYTKRSYYKGTYCTISMSYNCTIPDSWKHRHKALHFKQYEDRVVLDTTYTGSVGWKEVVTPEQFGSNAVDYLLQLINFIDSISDEIKKATTSTSAKTYGIDDIITGYGCANSAYTVTATLSPIDKVLGNAKINIHYDENNGYKLTKLTGEIGLLNVSNGLVTCNGTVDINLIGSTFGEAKTIAQNASIW